MADKVMKLIMTDYFIQVNTFGYFRWHNCIHDTTQLLAMMKYLNAEEAELFNIDLRKLDTSKHAQLFAYGVGKHYQGHDILPPDDDLQQILRVNNISFNHDINFARKSLEKIKQKDLLDYTQTVLSPQKFQNYLDLCFLQKGESNGRQ